MGEKERKAHNFQELIPVLMYPLVCVCAARAHVGWKQEQVALVSIRYGLSQLERQPLNILSLHTAQGRVF